MHPLIDAAWNSAKSSASVWGPFVSGLIAAFVAAFSVHLLTQSREREKWILDCKKQEFKELLNVVSDTYVKRIASLNANGSLPRVMDEDQQRELAKLQPDVHRVFRNCLYICDDLDLRALSNEWLSSLIVCNLKSLHNSFDKVSLVIVQAANRSVPKSSFQKLQLWKRRTVVKATVRS